MQSIRRRYDTDEGFTLIELLMVIIIMAILATVVIFSVTGITNNGQVAACQTQLRTLNTAAESYYAQNSAPAANIAALVTGGFLHSDGNFNSTDTTSPDTITVGVGTAQTYPVTFTSGVGTTPPTAGNATSTLAGCT